MLAVMTDRTTSPELFDDRSLRLFVRRIVVALEEFRRTAVHTLPVALMHHSPLAARWMTMPARRVDRAALCVMDEHSDERRGSDPFRDGAGDRCSIVERAAVAAHVQHDLRDDAGAAALPQCDESIGALLRDRRPPRRVRGRVGTIPSHQRVDSARERRCISRWESKPADDHAIDVDVPREPTGLVLARLRLLRRLPTSPPYSALAAEPSRRNVLRQHAQLFLGVRRRDTSERPDLAVRQATLRERSVNRA